MFDQCFRKTSLTILQPVHLRLSSSSPIHSKHKHLACDWLRIFACFSIPTAMGPTVRRACIRVKAISEEALMILAVGAHVWFLIHPRRAFILYLILEMLPLDGIASGRHR